MIFVHLIYDLTELYQIIPWEYSAGFLFLKNWGGTAFLLISGICATLGHHSMRRGLIVFGCGLLITVVTRLAGADMTIYFGVLHCLGLCMLLWHFFRKLSAPVLTVFGILLAGIGFLLPRVSADQDLLYFLGICSGNLTAPDYFPLLPNLGFFLLGAALGKSLYVSGKSICPAGAMHPVSRFLGLLGKHSLPIYLLHQPVLMLLMELILFIDLTLCT